MTAPARHPAVMTRLEALAASDPAYARMLANGLDRDEMPTPPRARDGRIRVGFHTPSLHAGGAERWVLDLARLLDRSRVDVVGISVIDPALGDPALVAEARGLAPLLVGTAGLRALDRACDVLIAWGTHDIPGLIGEPRSRVVIVSHTSGAWGADAVSGWERAAGLVAVSDVAVSPFPEAAQSRVVVIPNAVDPERVRAVRSRDEVRAAWGVPPGAKALGMLARVAPEKGPKALPDAVALLPPEWVGVHVGWGLDPYRSGVIAHAGRVAPGRVIYPGFDADVGSVLGAFDAFLLPSEFEGSSLALLEAWAAGVPAIATPVGIAVTHPDLVRMLPASPTGGDVARAVLADEADPRSVVSRVGEAARTVARLYSADRWAATWADYLAATVGAAERPKPAAVARTSNVGRDESGWAPGCGHRTSRWCCGGDLRVLCDLGRGAGGIVEAHDCAGCDSRAAHQLTSAP